MHLLVCVVNNTAKVNQIVAGFATIGVTGATVIDSHGTVEIAVEEVPIFAGFRQLLRSDRQSNRTIFSVIDDEEILEAAMALVEKACGDLEQPSTGIMFVVPVTGVRGLAPKIE
jgi:hypothetical protein